MERGTQIWKEISNVYLFQRYLLGDESKLRLLRSSLASVRLSRALSLPLSALPPSLPPSLANTCAHTHLPPLSFAALNVLFRSYQGTYNCKGKAVSGQRNRGVAIQCAVCLPLLRCVCSLHTACVFEVSRANNLPRYKKEEQRTTRYGGSAVDWPDMCEN